MNANRAAKLLSLPDGLLTREGVQAAFTAAVWKHHPDAQGEAVGDAARADIDQLKQARDTLLRQINSGGDFACRQCKGVGTVPARLGVRPCGACRGTGERNGG